MSRVRRAVGPVVAGVPIAAVLIPLLLVAACTNPNEPAASPEPSPQAPDESPTGPRNGGRLVLGLESEAVDLDPAASAWDTSTLQVARGVFDRLAVYDEAYHLTPELASSIEANSDFTEWTITVRRNVVFHDGQPVDAEAVKVNLEAQRQGPAAALLRPIVSVFVTGPRTVGVRMRAPWSTFPNVLTTQVGFVASPITLFAEDGGTNPVGTGPFALSGRDTGGSLSMTKNSSYWRDGLPRLDEVEVRIIPDHAERADALESGRLDAALFDDPATIAELRALDDQDLQVFLDPDGEAPKLTVVLNSARAPFVDFAARQAVGYATNRVAMGDAGFDGLVKWVRGPFSDTSLWYIDPPVLPHNKADAVRRAAGYEESYGAPLDFTLLVPDEPIALRYAAMWQRQLAEVGIDVTLDVRPGTDVEQAAAIGGFDAAMLPLFGDWHPDLAYTAMHLSEMTPVGSPGPNPARAGSQIIDESLDAARETDDLALQVDAYRAAQNDMVADGAHLFLVRLPYAVAAVSDVRDLTRWLTTSDVPGLAMEGGTVSLTEAWLDRAGRPTE
jgi:peptide/nickel transport system substrate-binding protein